MTWKQLEALAKRNGHSINTYDTRPKRCVELWLDGDDEPAIQYFRPTMTEAKRALCRAVEKIRSAK